MAFTFFKKNTKHFIILLGIFCFFLLNIPQVKAEPQIEWETLVGGPSHLHWGTGVDQTTDGGYVVVGYIDTTGTSGGGFSNIYLAKLTSEGRIGGTYNIGGTSKATSGTFVQQTNDGGYIIAGSIDQMGWGVPTGKFLVKTDPQGNIEWSKTFGEAVASGNSVYQTKDGGYIFAAGQNLIKTDSNGNQEWSHSYSENVMHAHQTSDEGFILVTGEQAIKLDVDGSNVWSCNLGVVAQSVHETIDGGCIATGGSFSLVKVDSTGVREWTQSVGSGDSKGSYSVQQTFNGGYVIAGTSRTDNNIDLCIVRTDENGVQLWEKKLGSSGVGRGDYGYHVELCDDGGYVVVGASDMAALDGVSDVYVIKIAPDTVPPLDPAEFIVYDLVIDPDSVEMGEDITFYVTVENIGDETGIHPLIFQINDMIVYNSSVTLGGGEFTSVSYVTSFEVNGTYSVSVDELSDTFRVRGPGEPYVPPEPEPEPAPIPEPEPEKTPTSIELRVGVESFKCSNTNEQIIPFGYRTYPLLLGITIEISFNNTNGNQEKESIYVLTYENGFSNGEFNLTCSDDNQDTTWEITASWPGNSEYEGSISNKELVIVEARWNPPYVVAAVLVGVIIVIVIIKNNR